MSIPLADYIDERKAFADLLDADCKHRVLLFQGKSGNGKTSLLDDCLARVSQAGGIHCVTVDFKGSAVPIEDIFSRSADALGRQSLTNFTRQMAEFRGIPEINIDRNRQTGDNNQINVALQVNDSSMREQRIVALTEALFDDMKVFEQRVLFVLDTYEQATSEVQKWLSGQFLARVARVSQVRTLIAGQEVPDMKNITWGRCCTLRELRGVLEAEHWMPVVEAMRRRLPREPHLACLTGICHALQGRPSAIRNFLEGLPLEETQP